MMMLSLETGASDRGSEACCRDRRYTGGFMRTCETSLMNDVRSKGSHRLRHSFSERRVDL